MNRQWFLTFLMLLPGVAVSQTWSTIDALRDFVVQEESAYGLMPPQALVSNVVSYEMDGSQTRVASVVEGPSLTKARPVSIVVSTLKTGSSKVVLKLTENSSAVANWVGAKHLLVTTSIALPKELGSERPLYKSQVIRLNVDTGATEVLPIDSEAAPYIQVHKQSPVALVHLESGQMIVGATGNPIQLDKSSVADWSGKLPMILRMLDERRQSYEVFEINPRTLAFVKVEHRSDQSEDLSESDSLFVERKRSKSENGNYVKPRWESWLGSRGTDWPTRALITSDGNAELLTDRSGVLVIELGTLSYRKIEKISINEFIALAKASEQRELMSQAKQCGLGILMYSGDFDDEWPPTAGFMQALEPYLKDASVMGSFEYLKPSQAMKDIKEPANTAIGQIQGKYGRAVVYSDGHVKWEPKG